MEVSATSEKTGSGEAPFADPALLEQIMARLRAARAVQVLGHVRPDGDCFGSLLAMHHLLKFLGKPHALAAEKISSAGYHEMEDFALVRETVDVALEPDLAVYVDAASKERAQAEWKPAINSIVIDHHTSNTRFGTLNWIEPRAAATCEMLFHLVEYAQMPLTPALAEALLVGITTDTGGFRFPNTHPVQHRLAARLLEAGASVEKISRMAWSSGGPEGMRLLGHVMHTMEFQAAGTLAWAEIREPVYVACGGELNAPENLADTLRSVRGVRVGLLFNEVGQGMLRVNFRSDGSVNVSKIAQEFGGGGHPAAAGLTIKTQDYSADRDRILARVLREVQSVSK